VTRTALVWLALMACCASIAVAQPASAQPSSETQASAEDLFQRGKQRFAAKDYTAACALYAESYRLDAAGGTLQNLGLCYEELGKWASAHASFEELRALSRAAAPPRLDRVRLAEEHIQKLTPKLSRVIIVVAEAPPGLVVRLDGTARGPISWADGIVVDPGIHAVDASAPDRRPFTARVEVGAGEVGERQTVQIPRLVAATPSASNGPPVPPGAGEPSPQRSSSGRTTALVIGGAGVVALGVGAVLTVLASEAKAAGENLCNRASNPDAPASDFDPKTQHCYDGTQTLRDANTKISASRLDANVANVVVPLGVAAVALGAYLFFRRSSSRADQATLFRRSIGSGSFGIPF
jgi:hypothetical protein